MADTQGLAATGRRIVTGLGGEGRASGTAGVAAAGGITGGDVVTGAAGFAGAGDVARAVGSPAATPIPATSHATASRDVRIGRRIDATIPARPLGNS